jgi:hypothetical protein
LGYLAAAAVKSLALAAASHQLQAKQANNVAACSFIALV